MQKLKKRSNLKRNRKKTNIKSQKILAKEIIKFYPIEFIRNKVDSFFMGNHVFLFHHLYYKSYKGFFIRDKKISILITEQASLPLNCQTTVERQLVFLKVNSQPVLEYQSCLWIWSSPTFRQIQWTWRCRCTGLLTLNRGVATCGRCTNTRLSQRFGWSRLKARSGF